MIAFEREGKFQRWIELVRRDLMRLLQQLDGPIRVTGLTRHDALEHENAIVGRAVLQAHRQQLLNRRNRARLLTKKALSFLDLAGLLGICSRYKHSRKSRQQNDTDPENQH
jgi:hypothetical protein